MLPPYLPFLLYYSFTTPSSHTFFSSFSSLLYHLIFPNVFLSFSLFTPFISSVPFLACFFLFLHTLIFFLVLLLYFPFSSLSFPFLLFLQLSLPALYFLFWFFSSFFTFPFSAPYLFFFFHYSPCIPHSLSQSCSPHFILLIFPSSFLSLPHQLLHFHHLLYLSSFISRHIQSFLSSHSLTFTATLLSPSSASLI